MNWDLLPAWVEPLVEMEIGHAESPSNQRVFDAVPLRVEEERVIFVLECRLTKGIEVGLHTLPFDHRLHLVFTGCLGPCAAGNNALLQIYGQAIWLSDLNDPSLVIELFDYAEAMLGAGRILPRPDRLRDSVYEHHLPFDSGYIPLVESSEAADGLDRLDPVCLMDVDRATARHAVEHNGHVIAFCAPSCKRQFPADPKACSIV